MSMSSSPRARSDDDDENGDTFTPLLNPIMVNSSSSNDPLGEHEEIEFSIGATRFNSNSNESAAVPEIEMTIKDGVLYPPYGDGDDSDSEMGSDSDGEWEETYLYLDLDDIPNLEELFAVYPDDFLLASQSKKKESAPKPKKQTHPKIMFKFHNFESEEPVLQIGRRFYQGTVEEPLGTSLFFRQKQTNEDESDTSDEPKSPLKKLTPDMVPPPDPVFGANLKIKSGKDFELVAKAHKVVRMKRRNLSKSMPTPSGLPVINTGLRLPRGFTRKNVTLSELANPIASPLETPPEEFNFKRPKTPPPLDLDSSEELIIPL